LQKSRFLLFIGHPQGRLKEPQGRANNADATDQKDQKGDAPHNQEW
jgi:hypothetical protein